MGCFDCCFPVEEKFEIEDEEEVTRLLKSDARHQEQQQYQQRYQQQQQRPTLNERLLALPNEALQKKLSLEEEAKETSHSTSLRKQPSEKYSPQKRRPRQDSQNKDQSGKAKEYRAFVIARHPKYGYLLLRAFKKRKGLHDQLPGGRIDEPEIKKYGLEKAALFAASREFYEETGVDLRNNKDRFRMLEIPDGSSSSSSSSNGGLTSSYKGRFYFFLELNDSDSITGYKQSLTKEPFYLKLSKEHVNFSFEQDLAEVAYKIRNHSGGKNTTVLRLISIPIL